MTSTYLDGRIAATTRSSPTARDALNKSRSPDRINSFNRDTTSLLPFLLELAVLSIDIVNMASPVKKSLQSAIAHLSEAECLQVMKFVQNLQHKDPQMYSQLASNPTFIIPPNPVSFQPVRPILGAGISASDQLLEDRR